MGININKEAPVTASGGFVVLELFKCARYVRIDTLYERGVPYKFTQEQAEILLDEVEEASGLPIWKRHRKAADRKVVVRDVQPQDMTGAVVTAPDMSDSTDVSKRVEIGDDSELAGLLPEDEEAHPV